MFHELFISQIEFAQLAHVIGEILLHREKFGVAGQACINGITAAVNDASVRQCNSYQTDMQEISRHLVGDMFAPGAEFLNSRQIGFANRCRLFRGYAANIFRISHRLAGCIAQLRRDLLHIIQFTGAMNIGMRRQNLFQQCRARTRNKK